MSFCGPSVNDLNISAPTAVFQCLYSLVPTATAKVRGLPRLCSTTTLSCKVSGKEKDCSIILPSSCPA